MRQEPHEGSATCLPNSEIIVSKAIIAALAAVLAFMGNASAQSWPIRPVTLIVPFAAGSGADVVARILSPGISAILGQQVVVENVGGAGGMTGVSRVAKASPDGYQFVLGGLSTFAMNQSLYKKPLYNAARDFASVVLIAEQPIVLIVRKDLPVSNVREFTNYTKVNQAKMQYGSGGPGSAPHLACALLNSMIGADVTHIPYRATIQAMQDMIAGRVDYGCPLAAAAVSLIKNNQVKAIAILTRDRSPILPDLASAHEQGLSNFDTGTWNAFFFPNGTPTAIIQKLREATIATMETPSVQERLKEIGATVFAPERRSPEYLRKFVESEIAKWAAVIKAAGVSAD
jgi:tripartite-type tricarboxylate transporter receptor subunit TctC